MGNISDRIGQIIKDRGISTRAFEQQIGCSNGVISKCINKGTDISSQWVTKIIETFVEINPRWLLTGEGSMLSVDVPSPFSSSPEKSEKSEKSERSERPEQSEQSESSEQSSRMMRIMLEQAKEIGRLQEQVRQLTIEQEKNAARANTASIANAG